jgi:hypothetical protein
MSTDDAVDAPNVGASINVPEDFETIAEALGIAEDGDTIYLAPGLIP